MNKVRRERLTEAIRMMYQAIEIIEACKDEEEDAFDNLPDSIANSEKGEQMEDYILSMEEAIGSASDAVESVDEIFY